MIFTFFLFIVYSWNYITKANLRNKLNAALAASQAKLTGRSRASLVERYLAIGPHRAFAVAPRAQDYWWTGEWPNSMLAEEKVLERCQIRFGEPCAVAALDDDVQTPDKDAPTGIHDMPRLHYAGDFDPAQIPGIRPTVAQRTDVVSYAQSPQPKAAAIHPRGILSIVTGTNSQRRAEIQALRSCNEQSTKDGDGDCFLYAIGNKVVLPMQASAAVSNP